MAVMAPRVLIVMNLLVMCLGLIEAQCNLAASCSGIGYGGSTMHATCRRPDGSQVASSIDLNNCIGNNNGQLDCSSGYFRSCAGIQYPGTTVSATCTRVDGSAAFSTRNINDCVRNNNGNLECC